MSIFSKILPFAVLLPVFASSQDSDIDMCHLHATGGYFDGDDEAHGHRRLPTAPMFEFLHDCGYLGIMWMKNARASVEHLL